MAQCTLEAKRVSGCAVVSSAPIGANHPSLAADARPAERPVSGGLLSAFPVGGGGGIDVRWGVESVEDGA